MSSYLWGMNKIIQAVVESPLRESVSYRWAMLLFTICDTLGFYDIRLKSCFFNGETHMKQSSLLTSNSSYKTNTLVSLLRWRADQHPDIMAFRFLQDDESQNITINYAELDRRARAIGSWLESFGAKGERALLLYSPGLDYIAAFMGCLYAGVTAVPAYPPRLNRPAPRIQSIVNDSRAKFALTTTMILSSIEKRFEHAPDLKALHWLNTEQVPAGL